MADIHGLTLNLPEGFSADEVMVTLKGPPASHLKDPRMLQKQHPVRPNLIIHRRLINGEADVELLCGEICAELVSAIDGMQNLSTKSFAFADGAQGMLVSFDFPVKQATVQQHQALRLDGAVFTTLTLTVDASTFNDKSKEDYFSTMKSVQPPKATNPQTPTA